MDNEDTSYIKFKNYSKYEQQPNLDQFEDENRFRLEKSMILGILIKNKAYIYNNYLTLINEASSQNNMELLQNILTNEFDDYIYNDFNDNHKI